MPEELKQNFYIAEKNLSEKSNALFFSYAINHSNSYVTLWKLIERFEDFGYRNEYYDIFNKLSPMIKSSFTAKEFYKKLKSAKLLAVDSKFPKIKLKNLLGKDILFNVNELKAKYTLVDFWFVNCGPCLKQFPFFKKIYDRYSNTDFNIVGISIDKKVDLDKISSLFLEKKLKWSNLLDENGVIATRLGINSFPTNFLLDQNGIIIRKNISPTELDLFLKNAIQSKNIYDNTESYVPK